MASVQPDLNGNFNYDYSNGQDVTIEKDIPGTTDMLPVINGFDALLTRKVLINDNGFIPSVFQMIAMDVNMDGVISAGDLSQIDQRAVLMIPEFRQAWNYDSQGNSNGQASKDWLFVDMTRLNSNPAYRISTTYPSDNGIGYSKSRVPVVPFCLPVPNSNVTDCPLLGTETYKGVLLGDINGNYATTVPNGMFRTGSSDRIFVDLSHATIKGGYADVPVSVLSNNDVNSLDLSTKFNEANLTFNSIVDHAAYMQQLSNFNSSDRTLRFTSSSLQNYEIGQPIMSIRFAVNGDHVDASDLNSLEGYINGERTAVEVIDTHSSSNTDNLVYVYPNPARDVINVLVSQNATIQLMGLDGKEVILKTNTIANEKQEINTSTISNGVYMMRIYNDNFVATKKIVIQN